ncbi:unnamed protein product, partial [Didymodactylos carnosus]
LKEAQYLSITSDMWTSDATLNFITVAAQFLDKNFILHSRVLETLDYHDTHNSDKIRERQKVLISWEILDLIVCVVTDNTSAMVKVGKDLNLGWLGCFAHLIQTIVKVGSDIHDIKTQIKNVEKTVCHIRRSYKAKDNLRDAQQSIGLSSRNLIQDVETRWNSTFYMLQRFVEEEPALSMCFTNQDFLNRFKDPSIITSDYFTLLFQTVRYFS